MPKEGDHFNNQASQTDKVNKRQYDYAKFNSKSTREATQPIANKSNELQQTDDYKTSNYEVLQKAALDKLRQIEPAIHPDLRGQEIKRLPTQTMKIIDVAVNSLTGSVEKLFNKIMENNNSRELEDLMRFFKTIKFHADENGYEILDKFVDTVKNDNMNDWSGYQRELSKKWKDLKTVLLGHYKQRLKDLVQYISYVKLHTMQDKHEELDKFVGMVEKGVNIIERGDMLDWPSYQRELSKKWKDLKTVLKGNERELIENHRERLYSRDGIGIDHYSIAYNTVAKNSASKLVETIGSTLGSIADILKENKDSKDPQAVIDKCKPHVKDSYNAICDGVNAQLVLFAGTKNALADALTRANNTSVLREHEIAVALMPVRELGECENALRDLRKSLEWIFGPGEYTQTVGKRWYVRDLEEGHTADIKKNQDSPSPQQQLRRAIQGFQDFIDYNGKIVADVKKSQGSSSSQDKIQRVKQGFSGQEPRERWVASNPNQSGKHLTGLSDKQTGERSLGDVSRIPQRKPSDQIKTITEAWETASKSWEKFRRKLEPIIPEEALPENWRSVVQLCQSPESITSVEALLEKCKREKASGSVTSGETSLENQEKDIIYVLQKILDGQREMLKEQQKKLSSKNVQPSKEALGTYEEFGEKHSSTSGPITPPLRSRL